MRITYDEVSLFTNKRSVLIEPDERSKDYMKLCMDTGYHTYQEKWKTGSDILDTVEQSFPKIVVDSKREMSDGNTWYKMILLTPFVMLTPELDGGDDVWAIYSLKDGDPTEDPIVMEVESIEGEPLYRMVDLDTKQVFPDAKFSLAMDAFQSIGAAVYGKIFEMINDDTGDDQS